MSRRKPANVVRELGFARIETAPKRPRDLGSAFWVARELPDFAKLPKLVRLTMYRSVAADSLPELFERIAASATLEDLALIWVPALSHGVSALPDDLAGLRRLLALHIEGAELSSLPASIGTLTHLEELFVLGSPLHQLPASIGELSNLTSLRVIARPDAPSLRHMPELHRLVGLEQLGLGHLPELEDADFLARLPALRTLELAGRVTAAGVPEVLPQLSGLRALALRGIEPPRTVARLASLETLSLVQGSCTRVPDWLPELGQLRYLAVFGNPELDPHSLVEAAAAMPHLARVFLPYPYDAGARARLKKLGFVSERANPSVMNRGPEGAAIVDPFPFVR